MQERYYKIGEVSELLGIEQYTLRYLENNLKLKINRDERGDRLYSETDLDTLRLVMKLREKGLNTTAIKMALENSQEESEEAETKPVPRQETGLVEMMSVAQKIVEQNEQLLEQTRSMQQRIDRLEQKVDRRNEERERKIDEFLKLWKAEQEGKGKSLFSWLRGK